MSLNRHTGLYSMPSHHRYGAKPAPRPAFNSMDFAAREAGSPSSGKEPAQQEAVPLPSHSVGSMIEDDSAPQEQKDKKKEKKNKKEKEEEKEKKQIIAGESQLLHNHTPSASTPLIKLTPATASAEGKKIKHATKSDKKRKRAGENHADPAPALPRSQHNNGGFVVGADMLHNVESSVKAAGEVFKFGGANTAANTAGEPSKKKSKKEKAKEKAGRKSNDTIDSDRMAKETRSVDRKIRKEAKARRSSVGAPQARESVAVPVSSTPIFSSPLPRKTPVPLPPNAFSHAVNASKADRVGCTESRLLVVDTPPSELPKTPCMLSDSPIPFKLTDASKKKNKGHKSLENAVTVSPPPAPVMAGAPSSAPPAVTKSHRLELTPDNRVSLTTSNLIKYMTTLQPLSDGPKPRPSPLSRAVSTAGSTTSGGTTPSIKDLFAHVGKPYSRSGAEIDPFVVPERPKKKNSSLETHDEASAADFTARFSAAQLAVNFSDEREYLAHHTAWRSAHAARPLPCLGQKASGCNPKRETALRLHTAEPDPSTHVAPSQPASTGDGPALPPSTEQCVLAAETLLKLSLAARVPIPLGPVEGVWRLFCPAYTATHIDRYGDGQRTLRIVSTPGLAPPGGAYTARLSIPPRSMPFPIRAFAAPPHASFRATPLRTLVEGYRMEALFLGGGYVLLRVDLQLLLSGKEGRGGEGSSAVMEFLGVHERAVVWGEEGVDEEDELEVVGRRLFAKYDGEA